MKGFKQLDAEEELLMNSFMQFNQFSVLAFGFDLFFLSFFVVVVVGSVALS